MKKSREVLKDLAIALIVDIMWIGFLRRRLWHKKFSAIMARKYAAR